MMKLNITVVPEKKIIFISVQPDATVGDLKDAIANALLRSAVGINVGIKGKITNVLYNNTKTLSSYGVKDGTDLFVWISPTGPTKKPAFMLDPIKTPAAERLGKAKETNIELDPSLLAVQVLAAWHDMASIWKKKTIGGKTIGEKTIRISWRQSVFCSMCFR